MERTYYTVYMTTNLINGKRYIGVHKTKNPDDDYLGSGKALNSAIQKYGKENFQKVVIFNALNYDYAHEIELLLVNKEWIESPDTYNMKVGGKGGSLAKTEEQKKKLSLANMGKPSPRKGVKLSEETKALIGSHHKGKFVDPEISKALWRNPDFREKVTGANHHSAKTYILTNSIGEVFEVTGGLKSFCEEHSLSYNAIKSSVGKGIIKAPEVGHRKTIKSVNSYGWSVELLYPQTSPEPN